MAAITPRRSTRIPHTHTPKMSDRKKSLFQIDVDPPRESLTQHRRLPVVDSESDTDDCDLGIIATLDSSSGDELLDQNVPRTPRREPWRTSRVVSCFYFVVPLLSNPLFLLARRDLREANVRLLPSQYLQ